MFYSSKWQDNPLVFVDHVDKFFVQEIDIFEGGAMGASIKGIVDFVGGPGCGFQNDWNPIGI